MTPDCTATGFSGEGRCIEPAGADGLCDEHAALGAVTAPIPPAAAPAIQERLEGYLWAWGWHPEGALDPDGNPVRAGYGHHMAQMLYRLPRDSQTDDMRRSVQSMLGDLHTLLARPLPHTEDCTQDNDGSSATDA